MISDKEHLRYLLDNERDVDGYIECNFYMPSFENQKFLMYEYPFFGVKVIDNWEMTDFQKKMKLLRSIGYGKSKIITIVGYRGSGKTATAFWIIEQLKENNLNKNFYYVKKGDRPPELPDFMNHVTEIEFVPKNSFAMLDETAIEYSSRDFMKDKNRDFTKRLAILRHKNISIMLITQHIKLIDINLRRLSDILLFKKGSKVKTSHTSS